MFELNTILTNKITARIILIDKNKYKVTIPNYISGTYFLSVISNNKVEVKKVIIP